MTQRTLKLTREQIELAKINVEADRLTGRTTDPLLARIATVGTEPVVVEASEIVFRDREGLARRTHEEAANSR